MNQLHASQLSQYQNLTVGGKKGLKAMLGVLSILILGFYAFILYRFDNNSKLGIVIAVSTLFMDAFTYLVFLSKLVDDPPSIIALMTLNRVLMVVLGDQLWIYGVMILYIIYGCFLVIEISRDYYPINEDVRHDRIDMLEISKVSCLVIRKKGLSPTLLLIILSALFMLLAGFVSLI